MKRCAIAASLSLLALTAPALAKPTPPKKKPALEVALGEHLHGPERAPAAFKGKVALFFAWSPADRERAPQLLAKALGLAQAAGEELSLCAVARKGEDLTGLDALPAYADVRVGGDPVREAVILRQDGTRAFRGDLLAEACEGALRRALADATPAFEVGVKAARVVKLAEQAAKGQYGLALRGARRVKTDGSEEERAQAALLEARLARCGQRQLEALDSAEDPIGAEEALEELKKRFGSEDAGKAATERLRELRRDGAFVSELKAAKLLRKLRALARQLQPCATCAGGGGSMSFGGDEDDEEAPLPAVSLACTGCRQKNRQLAGLLEAGCRALAKGYGATRAARAADALWKSLSGGGAGLSFGGRR
ncbi:MAG: hypothetical protein AB7N76_26210 [Planctomycetota bacterium]